jgi:putative copper export protein
MLLRERADTGPTRSRLTSVRFLAASLLSCGVLVLFLPVLCMGGEGEAGSCQSLASIQLPGSAEDGDVWQIAVLVAALLVFVLVMPPGRRSRQRQD